MFQEPLPEKYLGLSEDEALELIGSCKRADSGRTVILGHHYQRDSIIEFADFAGDSLKLSQLAAEQKDAEFIVFCGVHFMAESADILAGEHQKVLLPQMDAGCSMADMADIGQVERCWDFLEGHLAMGKKLVPVTYVNSTAAIKAFCGDHGGMCCTSSNCRAVFSSIWGQDAEAVILFLPDQHLGRNTAYGMGKKLERMVMWDPTKPGGGMNPEQVSDAELFLWDGFCCVHQEFSVEQIEAARKADPGVKVIVHPECAFDVAQAADFLGSTQQIIQAISSSEAGSRWLVGTERNLVERLGRQMAEKDIEVGLLTSSRCICRTMNMIDPAHLAWLMDNLRRHCENPEAAPLVNQVKVDEATKHYARLALERMLAVTAARTKLKSDRESRCKTGTKK
ncbi:MAG: quinolinate synthase NadA [Planctomycetes bacterium]|nr:quinolinate synthase NadA [Planctomycetota bacterium]